MTDTRDTAARDHFDCTPQQYHSGLYILWAALGLTGVQDEDVFTLAAAELERLQAIVDKQAAAIATVRLITVRTVPVESRGPCEGGLTEVLAGDWEQIQAAAEAARKK